MSERIAFIHSYLENQRKRGPQDSRILDRPTRACTIAAAELYRRNRVDQIAYSFVPELGNSVGTHLYKLLSNSLKKDSVITTQTSMNTHQEIIAVRQLCERNNPEKITLICIEPHKKRVIKNVKRVFGKNIGKNKLSVQTFEETLTPSTDLLPQKSKNRYSAMIKESKTWGETKAFRIYDFLVSTATSIPIIGHYAVNYLSKLSGKTRWQKQFLRALGWNR